MSAQSLSALGQIQATTRSLELDIMGAIVSIRHEDRQDIAINANYPDTWTIKGGSVRQTKIQVPFGNSNIVIGGSVSINGGVISTGRGTTMVRAGGRNVSIINGEVWVDGKKITSSEEPDSEGKPTDPDKLEIIVPNSYRGSLDLTNTGDGNVDIDSWQGGNFTLSLSGCGDLNAGRLNDVSAVNLHSSGTGDIEIESLTSQSFLAALTGTGDLNFEELNTGTFSLRQTGTGDATIDSGSAQSGSVTNSGTGDTTMRGRFGSISKRNTGVGYVKIHVRD
jgi:hypothetical protein